MLKTLCLKKLRCKTEYLNVITSFLIKTTSVSKSKFTMPKPGFYCVKVGRIPGIYTTWQDCEKQTKGFPHAKYKKFPTFELANNFLSGGSSVVTQQLVTAGTSRIINEDIMFDDLSIPDDVNFWSESDFNDDVTPVITSASELSTIIPKITYSKSSRDSYYAVHRGKRPGVYQTWTECSLQIKDFRNASYRKFENEQEALEYVQTGGIQRASKRELRCLDINNKVIKRRRLDKSSDFSYVLENPEETVIVFTDGASSENGMKRSRAGIGVYWGPNHPLNTSKRISGRQTNNRGEIYAAVHALNQAKQIGAKKVRLYTDSQFVIHAITDWVKKWKANKWKLVTGKDVVNKEDFMALDAAQEGLDVEWIYVKAHARNEGNDEADKLAKAGGKLLLCPENCSEFETVHNSLPAEQNEPFLISNASATPEEVISLILPDISDKKPFYAVHRGHNPGVYSSWTECERQIKNFPNPFFKKFFSEEEGKEFVRTGNTGRKAMKLPEYKEDEFVTVFTDGASSSNGKDDAQAGIGVYWGPGNALNSSMRLPGRQTNNRAEIWAAVHALRQAKQLGIKNVRLYTDSQFVIKGITTWIIQWKKKDWRLANGKPVINKDDFIALDEACQGLNVDWCYVKGHDNNPGNVEADQLAVAGCRKSLSSTMILG